MNFSGKDEATFFTLTAYQTRTYRKQYYWFPIHQSQIERNQKLRQLPYWN